MSKVIQLDFEGNPVKVEPLTAVPLAGVSGGVSTTAPSPVGGGQIVVPGSGLGLGGGLPGLEPTVADSVGHAISISHGSKDDRLAVRHSLLQPLETKPYGVCKMVVRMLLNFAWSEDRECVSLALTAHDGLTMSNPAVMENGNLALASLLSDFVHDYVDASNATPGEGGWKATHVREEAKAFGGNESEGGIREKIAGWFGRGGGDGK